MSRLVFILVETVGASTLQIARLKDVYSPYLHTTINASEWFGFKYPTGWGARSG